MENHEEIFKEIAGFPNYLISSNGRVWSKNRNKFISLYRDKSGYLRVSLRCNNKRKWLSVHRLVAKAFIDNPENKPQVDHINTDKADNRVENLRWATAKENLNNPLTLKKVRELQRIRGERARGKHGSGKSVLVLWCSGEEEVFDSMMAVSIATGRNYTSISSILHGRMKQDHRFKICWYKPITGCPVNIKEYGDIQKVYDSLGTGISPRTEKPTRIVMDDGTVIAEFQTRKEVANYLGVTEERISYIARTNKGRAKGYRIEDVR